LWLAAAVLGVFIPFDLFVSGYLIHGAVETLALLMVLVAARLLRDPRHLALGQIIGTVAVALAIIVVIVTGAARDGVLVWLALFPPVPFYLGGLTTGLLLSALFAAMVLPALAVAILIDAPGGFSWIAMLNAGGALLGSAGIAYLYELSRNEGQRQLAAAASTDPLTGVANRRGFENAFEVRRRLARRARQRLSVLVLDLDYLKQINDSKGHAAGDAAIRHVADLVGRQIREQDHLGRIGGDEFALVLPDTDLEGALTLAAKLRQSLQQQPLMLSDGALVLTLSIGAAEAQAADLDQIGFDGLLAAADHQLYCVKQRGRNGQLGERLRPP
jgi:diguanylate cyclase (GGDEF)-like protein